MNYLSLVFYAFIPVFLILYYVVPQRYRYIVIFIGSYIFYGYADIRLILILMVITIVTYLGGLAIENRNNRLILGVFFLANIFVLIFFKYTNFIIYNYNLLVCKIGLQQVALNQPSIILPVGLSFIVFQSCTYLTDVFRKNIAAEHNFIRCGAFIAFFPTVLSGPIQKARELLPQIECPREFDGIQAQKGTLLFVWGLFEKIMVANKLLVIVNKVFDDYQDYNSAYYIIAAVSFSLYIYADFSSYSDMARGIAKIMGIDIGKNFNNPYLSLSASEFWNRWHTSLNSWFMENIYIPLGGNRKGNFRKYVNMMVVFLISGLWHGANWHYVVWGLINGLLVIVGRILKPLKKRIYSGMHVNEDAESIRFCKRTIVFGLITITWVFFRNGISESMHIIKYMLLIRPLNFFDANLYNIGGTVTMTFIILTMTIIFCIVQNKRQNEKEIFERYQKQPFLMQCIPVAVVICICIFGICATDADVNTQFLYFQF